MQHCLEERDKEGDREERKEARLGDYKKGGRKQKIKRLGGVRRMQGGN